MTEKELLEYCGTSRFGVTSITGTEWEWTAKIRDRTLVLWTHIDVDDVHKADLILRAPLQKLIDSGFQPAKAFHYKNNLTEFVFWADWVDDPFNR